MSTRDIVRKIENNIETYKSKIVNCYEDIKGLRETINYYYGLISECEETLKKSFGGSVSVVIDE